MEKENKKMHEDMVKMKSENWNLKERLTVVMLARLVSLTFVCVLSPAVSMLTLPGGQMVLAYRREIQHKLKLRR